MPEEIEMVGNARRAHGKSLGDFARGEVALFQHLEDAAAGGIVERFEEKVQ